MSQLRPVVRYLIVCEDVQISDPGGNVSLLNLVSAIRSGSEQQYPISCGPICVFIQLTGCRGLGLGRVEFQHAETGEVVRKSPTQNLDLGTDPLAIMRMVFRFPTCHFPEPGLYWVQFWYNEQMIADQPLVVR
jgi:hypothetical protein